MKKNIVFFFSNTNKMDKECENVGNKYCEIKGLMKILRLTCQISDS